MVDIGGLEVFLIVAIALVVIGPQRLPELARFLGRCYGQLQAAINRLKQDTQVDQYVQEFKKEMGVDQSFKQQLTSITDSVKEVSDEINQTTSQIKSTKQSVKKSLLKKGSNSAK